MSQVPMYDINLLPIKYHQGQQEIVSAGFIASAAPRRASRSRSEDMLILSLSFNGDAQTVSEIQDSWVDQLIQAFFKTGGSVTSAMRAIIETLNLTLMEKNLKSGREVGSTTAAINLAAIHRRILYIAQSGSTHAFILNQGGMEEFFDSSLTDRGLGLSRSPNIRYYQAEIGRGLYFFTTDAPPETWTEDAIFTGGFPTLEQLRRRLLNQAPSEFRLNLAQITPGEGRVSIQGAPNPVVPVKAEDITKEESRGVLVAEEGVDQPGADENFDTQEIKPETPVVARDEVQSGDLSVADQVPETFETDEQEFTIEHPDVQAGSRLETPEKEDDKKEKRFQKAAQKAQAEKEKQKLVGKKLFAEREKIKQRSLKGLSAILSRWRAFRENIGTFFRDLIRRRAPADPDGTPRLSKGTLLLIALVVPLVLVGIAASVYFARGRTLQYQSYFEQAQLASNAAIAAEDPGQSRDAWQQTLEYLDQAETYKETDEISALRKQARAALDALDGAVRLEYQPAIIGSLYSEINITGIISYGPDLYLLDSAGGRVIHAERMTQGYEVDPTFVCAAGNYSGGRLEALVDMVSLPINNPYQAHILAVDALGNVAYCGPGQNPVVQSLPSMANFGGAITSIAYDNYYLYVLNPSISNILVYRPQNGQFLDEPTNFFEDMDVSAIPDLSLVVDIAVNGPELYLLQVDGKLIDCTTTGLGDSPVSCQIPVDYIDGRPGREEQVFTMPESVYSGLLYTTPPDPSISILDAQNADIYRFSLRFRLHDRLRPEMGDFEVESSVATAFTIGIDRIAFLAFGHQIFYAYVE
jgi:hypothetical protein